jgi:hypothetical protein
MSAVFTSIEKVGSATYEYKWSGTGPFRIVNKGEIIEDEYANNSIKIQSDDSLEPEPIEVLDAAEVTAGTTAESQDNSPRAILQWRGNRDANYYLVQQLVTAVWTTRRTIAVEAGSEFQGYYSFESDALDDGDAEQWRVIAVDDQSGQSQPLLFTFTVVAIPDPPSISLSYSDGTGLLTIAAR